MEYCCVEQAMLDSIFPLHHDIWGEQDAFGEPVFGQLRRIFLLQRISQSLSPKLSVRCELGTVHESARTFAGDLLFIYLRPDEISLRVAYRVLCNSFAIESTTAERLIALEATPAIKLCESPKRGAVACYCFSNSVEERRRMISLWNSTQNHVRVNSHLFMEFSWMLTVEELCS